MALLEWKTPKKIAEDTGLSRSMVIKLLDTGDIVFSKNGKRKNAGIMIFVSSFNKYWEKNAVNKKFKNR